MEDCEEDGDANNSLQSKCPDENEDDPPRLGESYKSFEEALLEQLREVRLSLNRAYEQSSRFSQHAQVVQQTEAVLRRLRGKSTSSSVDVNSSTLLRAPSDDSIEMETRIMPLMRNSFESETPRSQGREGNFVPLPPPGKPLGSPVPPPMELPPSLPHHGGEHEQDASTRAIPSVYVKQASKRSSETEWGFVGSTPSLVSKASRMRSSQLQADDPMEPFGRPHSPDRRTYLSHGSGPTSLSFHQQGSQLGKNIRGFEVHETWNENGLNVAHMITERQSVAPRFSEDNGEFIVSHSSLVLDANHQKEPAKPYKPHIFVLHPYSPIRASWDGLSLFLVVYDLIMIPFALLDPPQTIFTDIMNWITRLFWSVDVCMSLITGVTLDDGHIELRLHAIIRRYLKQWFLLDMIIVGSDWGEYILSDSVLDNNASGYAKAGKAGRAFRIVRMLRLLRLARMREVIDLMLERIRSERVIIVAGVLRMTSIILSLAHILACVWWGIGTMDEGNSWIIKHDYERQSIFYKYFMTLHWSLSQFAGGMDEVTPANTGERVYTILVFLTCFVAAAAFISTLTSSMTQLNIIGSQHSQQLSQMRKYLYQNGITNRLALRVMRNAKHAVHEQQRMMPEDNVPLLRVVSEPLRLELHFEMFSPILSLHPWIQKYSHECPQVMRKVCHLATRFEIVSAGDVLFNSGEIPSKPVMYIVVYGELLYDIHGVETEVKLGKCISEATLWTQWMHRGVLTAASDCRLCLLDSKVFQEIAGQFHHVDFDPRVYANAFVNCLNDMDIQDVTDLTFFESLVPRRGNKSMTRGMTASGKMSQVVPTDELPSVPEMSMWKRFTGALSGSRK